LKGAVAARRTNSNVLIIRIHKGDSEAGRLWRNFWAASMRLLHNATFVFCFMSSPGSSCGSFGCIKTCSMIECKTVSGPWEGGEGISLAVKHVKMRLVCGNDQLLLVPKGDFNGGNDTTLPNSRKQLLTTTSRASWLRSLSLSPLLCSLSYDVTILLRYGPHSAPA
jgi:hypothetical protein